MLYDIISACLHVLAYILFQGLLNFLGHFNLLGLFYSEGVFCFEFVLSWRLSSFWIYHHHWSCLYFLGLPHFWDFPWGCFHFPNFLQFWDVFSLNVIFMRALLTSGLHLIFLGRHNLLGYFHFHCRLCFWDCFHFWDKMKWNKPK